MSARIIQGEALTLLRKRLPDSVHCCVTSPPYWGLRNYGVEGAWGLEPTLAEYLEKMRMLFREVHRVLRKDGTLWLNMGDAYASGWSCSRRSQIGNGAAEPAQRMNRLGSARADGIVKASSPRSRDGTPCPEGLKNKDLIGLPWRLAFALQEDGWFLRSDIIWSKPNPMPESVTDRPTRAHEYIFLLTKQSRYWYDADAIRTVPSSETKQLSYDTMDYGRRDKYKTPAGWDTGAGAHGTIHRNGREKGKTDKQRGHSRRHDGFNDRWDQMEKAEQQINGANARSVWTIATQGYKGAHFATFPEEIPKRCILAGCVPGGTVLDPFAGSGTTLAVALALGRKAIGYEINPEYVALAETRLGLVTGSLFAAK